MDRYVFWTKPLTCDVSRIDTQRIDVGRQAALDFIIEYKLCSTGGVRVTERALKQ